MSSLPRTWLAYALAGLILALAAAIPCAIPARVSIGHLDPSGREVTAGWVVQVTPNDGLNQDQPASGSAPSGGGRVLEAGRGTMVWLVSEDDCIVSDGRASVRVRVSYEFLSPGKGSRNGFGAGRVLVALATPETRSSSPRVLSYTAIGLPVAATEAEAVLAIPERRQDRGIGLAIGLKGPGKLVIREVSVPGGQSEGRFSSRLAQALWGFETGDPSRHVTWQPWEVGARDYGGDPSRALVVLALWLGLLGAAMVLLSLLDFGLATVCLGASLAIACVEPSPFEALLLVWLVVGGLRRQFRLELTLPPQKRVVLFAGLLVVFSGLSWLLGDRSAGSLLYLAKSFYGLALGLAFAGYCRKPEQVRSVLAGLVVAGAIGVVGFALGGLVPGSIVGRVGWLSSGGVTGFMKDKNVLGVLQVLTLVALWTFTRWRSPVPGRAVARWPEAVMLGVLGTAIGFTILMSLSRTAWAGLLLAMLLLLLVGLNPGDRSRLAVALVVLVVTSGAVVILRSDLGQALAGRLAIRAYDLQGRFPMYLRALTTGLGHPFGVGPAYFERTFAFSVHNVYLRVFAENGWVSLVSYLAMLSQMAWIVWRKRRDPLGLTLGVGLAVLFLSGLVIDTLHWRFFWVLLGASLAYAACPGGRSEVSREAS